MVLRHLLIASQLQLLDSPPSPPALAAAADTAASGGVCVGVGGGTGSAGRPGDGSNDGVGGFPAEKASSASAAGTGDTNGGVYGRSADIKAEGGREGGESARVGQGALAGVDAGEEEGGAEEEASASEEWARDWHGTNSDAFEIAIAVLKVGEKEKKSLW